MIDKFKELKKNVHLSIARDQWITDTLYRSRYWKEKFTTPNAMFSKKEKLFFILSSAFVVLHATVRKQAFTPHWTQLSRSEEGQCPSLSPLHWDDSRQKFYIIPRRVQENHSPLAHRGEQLDNSHFLGLPSTSFITFLSGFSGLTSQETILTHFGLQPASWIQVTVVLSSTLIDKMMNTVIFWRCWR